jgi:hypothetical protein
MLARMLLEVQGATLACNQEGRTWSARIEFAKPA